MKSYLLSGLIFAFTTSNSMEQPRRPILYREPKSLKEIAYAKNVENLKTMDEFNTLIAVIPADLHCDLVKKIIHNRNFTREQILELINKYCNKNILLKAYTYYSRITPENREISISILRTLKAAAQLNHNAPAFSLILEFISVATAPDLQLSLIKSLMGGNRIELLNLLLSLGEQPTLEDLNYAIRHANNNAIQLLINAKVPLHNPQLSLTEQPLYNAFINLNETVINTLINNGVPVVNTYAVKEANKKETIPNYLRRMIDNWHQTHAWTYPGKTMQQMEEHFNTLTKLLNEYAPVAKDLSQRRSI